MSIPHAANRFLRTPIKAWDGIAWTEVSKGSLLVSDRPLSGSELPSKLRTLLVSPSNPIPSDVSVVQVGADEYLIGLTNPDISVEVYSLSYAVRKAPYRCDVVGMVFPVAASGAKLAPTRSVKLQTYCDKGQVGVNTSAEFATVEYTEELIILPIGVSLDSSYELRISDTTSTLVYDIQEVWQQFGMTYCKGLCRRTAVDPL